MILPWELFKNKHVETVVIIGPGPSLTKEQVDLVNNTNCFKIAIADAGRVMCPQADIIYHAEASWWNYYLGCPEYKGIKACMEITKYSDVYQCPKSLDRYALLDFNFPYLATGYNTGYQAIGLAVHFTPKKIILIGCDMKDTNGKHNIIGDHPKEIKRSSDFELYSLKIGELVKPLQELGIKVYNSTIDTALNCFEKKNLRDALAES